ncbi:hypothetical protein ACFVX6_15930 [Streptomyces sp. NPDC058289]|uniref:hypothetical protein n=1 Tax=Streptomyces sp. NPDC058289 TaxID=3346425 RepID=UPI0036F014B1
MPRRRGEKAKAEHRAGGDCPALQRTVRQAAALAVGDTDDDEGVLVGYAVALPGDRADGGTRPVWFSGSSLAYDLSLPRVRERFDIPVGADDWARAEARIREAAGLPGRAGRAEGAGDVAALGDLLVAAAVHAAPALVRARLQAAAEAFEQARPSAR